MQSLDKMTSIELKNICRQEHIHGYSGLNKKNLLKYVKTHRLNTLINAGISKLLAL
jgi:hypothetical protein